MPPIGDYSNGDEEDRETSPNPNNLDSDTVNESSDTQESLPTSSSSLSSRNVGRKSKFVIPQQPTAANVLQGYLSRKEQLNCIQSDPMVEFFINMAKTVKTFLFENKFTLRHNCFKWLIM